jgi:Mg-chelatase subunit ChlD
MTSGSELVDVGVEDLRPGDANPLGAALAAA